MDKFDKLVKELNDLQIHQQSGDWAEDLPEEIWNEHFKDNHNFVKYGLDVDKHRWYELSTQVVEIYGRLLGVTSVTDTSGNGDVGDNYHHLYFREMEEFTTISYKDKK